ncbi:uncharacterized protein LOC134965236 [Pseudophryne corroboree]|uniref:uncharacterized protein LOC134965236 n=1 Tax=Pseudophryne corroboree TaxID=495146 RepID=UPI00308190DE
MIRQAGLTIRPDKCHGMAEVQYLGHRVGGGSIRPEPAKVEAIVNWPQPANQKQVRAFLGVAGCYRKFIPHYSTMTKALTDLTKKKYARKIKWTVECEQAFSILKDMVTLAPALAALDYNKKFIVQTDTSRCEQCCARWEKMVGNTQLCIYLLS